MNARFTRQGFTLIEAIVSLLLVSVMAAAMMGFLDTYSRNIAFPRRSLNDAFQLQSVMENMVSDFHTHRDMDTLSTAVGAESSVQANAYGAYTVIHNRFIDFNVSNQEVVASATNRLLKVSIRNNRNESLTRLFGVR